MTAVSCNRSFGNSNAVFFIVSAATSAFAARYISYLKVVG